MASLTSGSWAIAGVHSTGIVDGSRVHESVKISGGVKIASLKMTVTGGSVPAGGIPFPAIGKMGMVRNLNHIMIQGSNILTSGVHYEVRISGSVDTTRNFKMVAFQPTFSSGAVATIFASGNALATTAVLPQVTFFVEAQGW